MVCNTRQFDVTRTLLPPVTRHKYTEEPLLGRLGGFVITTVSRLTVVIQPRL